MSTTTPHPVHIGDNLDVLPLLDGPFDLIYLDPPYNTGGTGRHRLRRPASRTGPTSWQRVWPTCRACSPRSGIVIASIDDREIHHLRILLDDVLGAGNYRRDRRVGRVDHQLLAPPQRLPRLPRHLRRRTTPPSEPPGRRGASRGMTPRPCSTPPQTAWRTAAGDRAVAQQRFRAWLAPRRSSLPRGLTEYDRIDETGALYRVGDPGAPSVQASRSFREL